MELQKKRPVGRPSNPDTLSFDSMAAACEHIGGGCTPEMLRAAKKAGCGAFRNGRIYVKELSDWLKNNKGKAGSANSKEALQIENLKEELIRRRRENAEAEGRLVPIDTVQEINTRMDAEIIRAVDEALSESLIHKMMGANFAACKVLLTEAKDIIFHKIHAPTRA